MLFNIFSNIIGVFIFDNEFNIKEKVIFKDISYYRQKDNVIKSLKEKYNAKEPENNELSQILAYFKGKELFKEFYQRNLAITRESLKNFVTADLLIIQAIKSIGDLDKAVNILIKRLREWYELYNPEFSKIMGENEKFVELLLRKSKDELLKDIKVKKEESIGGNLNSKDLGQIKNLAYQINEMYKLRKGHEKYLESIMKDFCPNLNAVAGCLIGAKLIDEGGSLRKLSQMPSSKIQILGAEKALFRHMKTGAKPPKHGVIYSHPIIQQQKVGQGSSARALANKISIAVKVDYFKGEFIGEKLRKELEYKFNKNKGLK